MPVRKITKSPEPVESRVKSYEDLKCEKCRSGKSPSKLLICDQCDRGYHLFCLNPILPCVPKSSWYCPSCSSQRIQTTFPLVQTKIIDFFRIQKTPQTSTPELAFDSQKKRKRTTPLIFSKKKRKLLPFTPSEEPERRLRQMRSLATALMASGTNYSDELTYHPQMAPRSANRSELEKDGMQILSKEDTRALNLCKRMMKRGECPPLMVVYDPREGFTVEADRFIRDLTIITEYVGDVDYLRNREHDDGDSTMTLLVAADPSNSLVICPYEHGNIARFINGINNHTPEGKKKQNLKCVRYSVNGECRALLVANRDICKGERLYYDYNAYENEYPTQHFV